jgi:hypothetical protein
MGFFEVETDSIALRGGQKCLTSPLPDAIVAFVNQGA